MTPHFTTTHNNFTDVGLFTGDIEQFLGRSGVDALSILKNDKAVQNKDVYKKFLIYDKTTKISYTDFTFPTVVALNKTWFLPSAFLKESSKVNKNINPLADFISVIAGIILFGTCYNIVKLIYTLKTAKSTIKAIKNAESLFKSSTDEDNYSMPAKIHLIKICNLRKKIYKKVFASTIIGIVLKTITLAAGILSIVGASIVCYPLLIAATAATVVLVIGSVIKYVVEKNNRLNKARATNLLMNTEALRSVQVNVQNKTPILNGLLATQFQL